MGRDTRLNDTIRDDGNAGFISWIDPYNGAFRYAVFLRRRNAS